MGGEVSSEAGKYALDSLCFYTQCRHTNALHRYTDLVDVYEHVLTLVYRDV